MTGERRRLSFIIVPHGDLETRTYDISYRTLDDTGDSEKAATVTRVRLPWEKSVKVPLGMGGLKLKFNFEKLEERPIEFAKLSAKGQGVGAIVNMATSFHLTPDGDRTSMKWEADVRVMGPIGSMGQRVFQPIVNQQVTNVLNALELQVAQAKGGGAAGAEAGIHAGSPEAYSPEPEGPTHSTDE